MKKRTATILLLWVVTARAEDIFIKWREPSTRSEEQRSALHQKFHLKKLWESALVAGLERLEIGQNALPMNELLRALRAQPELVYAEANARQHRSLLPMEPWSRVAVNPPEDAPSGPETPNDSRYAEQWALRGANGIYVEGAWAIAKGSADIKVAVIDTGVDAAHPDLAERVLPGFDFIDETAAVSDHHGHGTHVAGIIGARVHNNVGIAGINHDVRIVPIRAVPSDGDESDADLIQAFEFAANAGARIANCSFGKVESSQAVADTIAAAGEKGLLVVAAAGNDGKDLNTSPIYPANFHLPNMIVVAATDSAGRLSAFSNFGLGFTDIGAPGTGILSTIRNAAYGNKSGTSMAAPHVSGVAALALSVNPGLDFAHLKQIVLDNARPLEGLRGKVDTGGLVDAEAVVRSARDALPTLPQIAI